MSDEMLNKTKPYKPSNVQGISDTVKLMEEYDMNQLTDPIGAKEFGKKDIKSHSKNS